MLSGITNWIYQNSLMNQDKIESNKKHFYYLSLLNNNNKWHIHGLWPQYNLNSYPKYCNKNEKFNYETVKPLLTDLNLNWYSGEETNEEFWKHEWLKHGTCMFNKCSEEDYFKTALFLLKDSESKSIIEKFKIEGTNKSMVPYDLKFNIIKDN